MALNNIEKIRFWCHKVLPLVYDDSLSYYETVCKVVHYLNETIEAVNLNNETVNEIAKQVADFIGATPEMVKSFVDTWLSEHPEATTTVQDGSLTEEKFSEELKLHAIKDYVTPEMFGAVGDGVTDDTVAVQRAIDSGKRVLILKTYAITTLTVASNNGFSLSGKIIEGNGGFILTSNVDGIVVTGSGHKIKGIQLSTTRELQDNGFDGAFIRIISTDDLLSQNHTIDVCISFNSLAYIDTVHNSKGIQITAEGKGYSYNNIITAKIWGTRYGVYCESSPESLGINANTFNLNCWVCDCGFYGLVGGSVINGNCQARTADFTFNFFENFTGTCNLINAYVFDLRYAKNNPRQFLIDDGASGEDNFFTTPYHDASIKNYKSKNKYVFMDSCYIPSAGFNTAFPKSQSHIAIAPYSNCLKTVETALVEQNNVKGGVASNNNYPSYNYDTKEIGECAYLCKDNHIGRYIAFSKNNAEIEEASATITITVPTDTIVQYIYIELLDVGSVSCTLDGVELPCVEHNSDCAIFFNGGMKTSVNNTITLKFNITSKTLYIKRISAIGYSWLNGTI